MVGLNGSTPVNHCSPWRMVSMFSLNATPSRNPDSVPTTPTLAPARKKMRMTEPLVAPIVRRIAIPRDLSLTSMIRLEMMLNAATRMISVKIKNITLRST